MSLAGKELSGYGVPGSGDGSLQVRAEEQAGEVSAGDDGDESEFGV